MNKISVTKELKVRKTDPETLVLAVKKYPSIWNSGCPEYRQKKTKQESWTKVAFEVIGDWTGYSRTEKQCTRQFLIRRWNNIRDYYYKSLKAEHRAKLKGEPYEKKYVLADALNFIRPELEKNMNISERELSQSRTLKLETEEETQEEEIEDYVTFVDTLKQNFEDDQSRKKVHNDEGSEGSKEDDPDLMFLKSLLPDMKKLADDEKFAFKYAIMQAYMAILKKRN